MRASMQRERLAIDKERVRTCVSEKRAHARTSCGKPPTRVSMRTRVAVRLTHELARDLERSLARLQKPVHNKSARVSLIVN